MRILTAAAVEELRDFADTVACDPIDPLRARVRALMASHEALRARVAKLEEQLRQERMRMELARATIAGLEKDIAGLEKDLQEEAYGEVIDEDES
jgi:chromosome segregation ATPase